MKAVNKTTVDKAVEKTKEAGRQAVDKASTAAEAGKQEVVAFLEEQKDEATSKVRDLDQLLRNTAEEVSNPGIGQQISRLADGLEKVAESLETTHYDDVVRGAERMSRERPAVFMAASFMLGMALSRFLKSTSSRSIHTQSHLPQSSY